MKYAFIDYENIHSLNNLNLNCYEKIFLFLGANLQSIQLSEKFNRSPTTPAQAARAVTGGPSLTSRGLGDSVAYDLYHTLLLVMDRTRLLPDEAYLEPPDPFEDETDDQPPRPWNADWIYQDDQGHWHLDPDRAGDDPDGFRTWTTTHPVMAATTASRCGPQDGLHRRDEIGRAHV